MKDNNDNLTIHIVCMNGNERIIIKEILNEKYYKGLNIIKEVFESKQQSTNIIYE